MGTHDVRCDRCKTVFRCTTDLRAPDPCIDRINCNILSPLCTVFDGRLLCRFGSFSGNVNVDYGFSFNFSEIALHGRRSNDNTSRNSTAPVKRVHVS